MKILHVVGARPNFMKVTPVMAALSKRGGCSQVLVHTGQHYTSSMSDIFFEELALAKPNHNLDVGSGSHTFQTAQTMERLEPVLLAEGPDLVLVYGDVNSTVAAAIVCAKSMIPLGHVEAGLRSFDRRMPEEVNRIITDRLSDLLFAPSSDGERNLLREGTEPTHIYMVGNVMIDTLIRLLPMAEERVFIGEPKLNGRRFVLVTLHRPSNVDVPERLKEILLTLNEISSYADILFPVHPRTRQMMRMLESLQISPRLNFFDPVGYLDFLNLQRNASLVITDSGGIQEETTYLGVPCLTLRDNTERPITVDFGSNILIGHDMDKLKTEAERALSGHGKCGSIPPLWDGLASERIAEIVLTHQYMQ